MEGYLSIWINYVLGWKKRYFVLREQGLHYCSERGQPEIGVVHLKTAKILHRSNKPKKIRIDTGFSILHLKANTDEDGRTWAAALMKAKEEISGNAHTKTTETSTESHSENQAKLEYLQSKLGNIWTLQIQLISSLDNISESEKQIADFATIASVSHDLKYAIADAINLIEDQMSYFKELSNNLQEKIPKTDIQSEEVDESAFYDLEPENSQDSDKPIEVISTTPQKIVNPLPKYAKEHEIPHRNSLPFLRNSNEKIKVWQLIKDSIGKELYRIAVPVYLNEPISFLQKFSEDLCYNELILNANICPDSCMRLAYISCFAVSSYTSTINRHMKPFNPLLGETFELEMSGFRLISEQVSHHPPISALHCDHKDYTFWAATEVKSSFRGTYLQINPTGANHILLKRHNEHYVWNKPTTRVNNIILGTINLEHCGNIEIINQQTGDKAVISFRDRGWFGKNTQDVIGVIYDKHGVERFSVFGRWNERMAIKDLSRDDEILAYERYPPPEGYENNYYFTDFALQLNLPPDNFPGLIHTDSRFRPDQRALENGDFELAASEKARLEEKQRRNRRYMELEGIIYSPRWFIKSDDEWIYKGDYWETRALSNYKDIPYIY